jgi:hypothetical protein
MLPTRVIRLKRRRRVFKGLRMLSDREIN